MKWLLWARILINLHEVMFSENSDEWQNGYLINLKCKKLKKKRKEKLELELNKACSLLEFKRIEFELNFYYVESSSISNLYTCSNSSGTNSNRVRVQAWCYSISTRFNSIPTP